MQISKSSWHYRLNDWMQESFCYRSRSEVFTTCSYIRTTVFSMMIGIIKLIWIALVTIFSTAVIIGIVYLPLYLFGVFGEVEGLVIAGFIGWAFVLLIAFAYALDKLTPFFEERKERKIAILKQAMLDNKAGICTIIEYKD